MEWELFNDASYYDMFAVRPKGDQDFNSPRLFHFARREDAEIFKELAERANIALPLQQNNEDELWDELDDIFDKHTKASEGGYGADYTDKWSFFRELKSKYQITRKNPIS